MDRNQLPRFQTHDTDTASQNIKLTDFYQAFSFQRVYTNHINRRVLSNFDETCRLSNFHSFESTKESVSRGVFNTSARTSPCPSKSLANQLNVNELSSARLNIDENHSEPSVHESKSISFLCDTPNSYIGVHTFTIAREANIRSNRAASSATLPRLFQLRHIHHWRYSTCCRPFSAAPFI